MEFKQYAHIMSVLIICLIVGLLAFITYYVSIFTIGEKCLLYFVLFFYDRSNEVNHFFGISFTP